MAGLVLERLSDFGDYSGHEELTDVLNVTDSLGNVRLSPKARHIHIILRKPDVGLVTFDKYERTHLAQQQKRLELRLAGSVPVVDVLYLDYHNNNNNNNNNSRGAAVVAVVFENGKAEFWKFQECKAGWHLLQSSDLCNSPRARVVSVCVCSNLIIWCEERPPSESSTRNKLTYCICRRDFEVEEGAVILGGVKIALHNNPKFTVIASGEYVHLLPDLKAKPLSSISKFFLSWSSRQDSFTVSSTCKNTPLKRFSAKESDFKKLVTDCLGYLSALDPPEIYSFAPTACGGLLLFLSTGWLCLLQKDGILRHIYKLDDNYLVKYGAHTSLCLYGDMLAFLTGQNLHIIDLNCGRELEKTALKREGLLYPNQAEKWMPYLLSETGLYVLVNKETDFKDFSPKMRASGLGAAEGVHPGALLVEAVFEEACAYYQQRSLSSTQLTVETLKKGGRFQAPISLASILRGYLNTRLRQRGGELPRNGEAGFILGQEKLMLSLEPELKVLVSLEEMKGRLLRGSDKEVEVMCENLVEKEVERLLSSSELDKGALLYLNSIFSLFPSEAWSATQAALQLHSNGDGRLSSNAPPDLWKTVLSTASSPSAFTNGGPKHNHSFKSDHISNCKTKPSGHTPSAALPVFELLCQSVFRFQPTWLPGFLELAQQQQGSAGLGLSLATSSWSFSSGRGGERVESNVPLYKRALCTLSSLNPDREQQQDLEVELLLVSGRPNAVLQALRILMSKRQWERATRVAHKFCKQSPLLNKEIFTTLLCEVAQHRDLDPYLNLLWDLCPEDFTVTTILNLVLKNLPSPTSSSSSSSSSSSCGDPSPPAPFSDSHSSQLTVGLLKPLLRKVLQRETKPSQRYVDILQSPSFPPPALPRQPLDQRGAASEHAADPAPCSSTAALTQTPEQHTHTNIQTAGVALPANQV
ncbi:Hermansky-Pudlak syndrome 6 protein [Salarias fasciatus]|uniref:Hermansky-Pudlak syndrome 6 protein n=1 Tax=Salarias fasciatus TaxID=181472 RepID=UPI00117689A0|nr:Hermansky-Pudlak syndrome 6 protein [Salarias fasciatus]